MYYLYKKKLNIFITLILAQALGICPYFCRRYVMMVYLPYLCYLQPMSQLGLVSRLSTAHW